MGNAPSEGCPRRQIRWTPDGQEIESVSIFEAPVRKAIRLQHVTCKYTRQEISCREDGNNS
jgi:hypothetical protein